MFPVSGIINIAAETSPQSKVSPTFVVRGANGAETIVGAVGVSVRYLGRSAPVLGCR